MINIDFGHFKFKKDSLCIFSSLYFATFFVVPDYSLFTIAESQIPCQSYFWTIPRSASCLLVTNQGQNCWDTFFKWGTLK